MKIKVHSLIDVITNSSTEIFTMMNDGAIDGAYELLDEVLKVAGSKKKARGLFLVQECFPNRCDPCNCCGDDEPCESGSEPEIEIIAKDKSKSTMDIWAKFHSLFSSEERYS